MPAVSKAQQKLFGACEHGAGWASCPKGMTKAQMHDFAATKTKGLPMKVKKMRGGGISVMADIGKQKGHMTFKEMGIKNG